MKRRSAQLHYSYVKCKECNTPHLIRDTMVFMFEDFLCDECKKKKERKKKLQAIEQL